MLSNHMIKHVIAERRGSVMSLYHLLHFGIKDNKPGFIPAKMPYQRSSLMNEVALSTAPRYTPGPSVGGKG